MVRYVLSVDGNGIHSGWTPAPMSGFSIQWDSRRVSNGPHVLSVTAHDAAGNSSSPITVSVLTDNDLVSPQVALTSPASGAAVSGLVSIEAAASDDRGIAKVEFYAGYELIGTDTTAPYAIAVEALCDTRTLVRGRARIPNGPELNTPNTLDGCFDKTEGAYRRDESLERIRVIREDGTPLAAGKRVRIEADVYVYNPFHDFLDLYYTANAARSPLWTYLTTVQPTAKGFQRLSAEYVARE